MTPFFVVLFVALGVLSVGAVTLTAILGHWLYLDHRARKAYSLRVHNREHALAEAPGCRFCERR